MKNKMVYMLKRNALEDEISSRGVFITKSEKIIGKKGVLW